MHRRYHSKKINDTFECQLIHQLKLWWNQQGRVLTTETSWWNKMHKTTSPTYNTYNTIVFICTCQVKEASSLQNNSFLKELTFNAIRPMFHPHVVKLMLFLEFFWWVGIDFSLIFLAGYDNNQSKPLCTEIENGNKSKTPSLLPHIARHFSVSMYSWYEPMVHVAILNWFTWQMFKKFFETLRKNIIWTNLYGS